MADQITVEYNNDTGPNDEGFWEWWSVLRGQRVIAKCDTEADANSIAALLRFQSAMTPEMWEILRFDDEKNPSEERLSRNAWAALDTLRQELQQS